MKNLICVILLSFLINSCENQNVVSRSLEGETYALADFFEYVVKEIDVAKENVLYIDYSKKASTDEITIVKIDEKEPDFFVLATDREYLRATYMVECVNGDDSWNADCTNKFNCGGLIADCLDQSRCTTICSGEIIYIPPTNTFHVIRN